MIYGGYERFYFVKVKRSKNFCKDLHFVRIYFLDCYDLVLPSLANDGFFKSAFYQSVLCSKNIFLAQVAK